MIGLVERKSVCSKQTVLTFKKVGRLGNQLSSYANMLISERLFYVESYFPSKAVRENVMAFFENVSMPVLTEDKGEACSVEVGVSSVWSRESQYNFSGCAWQSSQCSPWRICGAVAREVRGWVAGQVCVTPPTSLDPTGAWSLSLATPGLALRCSSRRGTGCSPVILGSARIVRNRPPDWGRARERSRERP